ncbi:MAG: hypothetical protein M3Y21_04200 [Candidatus Eremiobacteraeota bacterium]|nr:hypothetical protein [Candidatus Eremiobacteraeota bacterium]
MRIQIGLLLLLSASLCACSSGGAFATRTGRLVSGSTLSVRAEPGNINAYPPAVGEPSDLWTVQTAGSKMAGDSLVTSARYLRAIGHADYLVRVPKGVRLSARTTRGSINISDVSGPVDAEDNDGTIHIQIPGYATARTLRGNISVTFSDLNWPGTLHFSSQQGDVEVWVPAIVNAHVHLHTDRGTIFSDFGIRGTARGTAETIDAQIGSASAHGIDIEVKNGSIRFLRLVPQM